MNISPRDRSDSKRKKNEDARRTLETYPGTDDGTTEASQEFKISKVYDSWYASIVNMFLKAQ